MNLVNLIQHAFGRPTFGLHSTCKKCGTKMRLVSIEPDKPNHDAREFECTSCSYAARIIVKYK